MPQIQEIGGFFDAFAPPALAAEWDNVGLLLGDANGEVRSILTCLTITPEVVSEAIETGVQLIVSHHPILFKGVKNLSNRTAEGRLLWPLARAGIAVYSPHTAFDDTQGGINDSLARLLGLVEVTWLRKREGVKQIKLVIFVPESELAEVSDALFTAGAGKIGQYRECSFRLPGTGTFFGSEETNPTVGQKGRREEVAEWRLEVVCPESRLDEVIRAMRKAHSYEEPAFDVYPLKPQPAAVGIGRIGRLPQTTSLIEFAQRAKQELKSSGVQMVGERDAKIQTIAIACGAAGEFLPDAIRAKADVFLTGEMRFHDFLSAKAQGISLVLPGHYATERPAVEELASRLQSQFPDLRIQPSRKEVDPVAWV